MLSSRVASFRNISSPAKKKASEKCRTIISAERLGSEKSLVKDLLSGLNWSLITRLHEALQLFYQAWSFTGQQSVCCKRTEWHNIINEFALLSKKYSKFLASHVCKIWLQKYLQLSSWSDVASQDGKTSSIGHVRLLMPPSVGMISYSWAPSPPIFPWMYPSCGSLAHTKSESNMAATCNEKETLI